MSVESHPQPFRVSPGGSPDATWPGRAQPSHRAGSPAPALDLAVAGAVAPGRRQRPPKLYRIGEVVDYSGVSRQTIHNYTTMGLIRESRWTTGGHRLFDESVFERLDRIAEMKAANKSLQDIRDHFAELEASSDATASRGAPGADSSE